MLGQRKVDDKSNEITANPELHGWPGLKGIVAVESTREFVDGRIGHDTPFYITSLPPDAGRLGEAVRGHWGVESHHWVMDILFCAMPEACFQHDECRICRANAPANFATITHMAHPAHGEQPTAACRPQGELARKIAAWDDEYLAKLIGG